jgi:hypothetical protein
MAGKPVRIVEVTCGVSGCGYSPFPMEENYHARVQRTGEWFRCPAGHNIHYNQGLTADQKRIKALESDLAFWKEMADDYRGQRDLAVRSCQWIECGFVAKDWTGLRTHMRARHGMPTLAAVQEAS